MMNCLLGFILASHKPECSISERCQMDSTGDSIPPVITEPVQLRYWQWMVPELAGPYRQSRCSRAVRYLVLICVGKCMLAGVVTCQCPRAEGPLGLVDVTRFHTTPCKICLKPNLEDGWEV